MGSEDKKSNHRLAVGIGLGLPFGVVLGMLLDNPGMGIALGLIFGICYGVIGWRGGDDEGEDAERS